MNTCGENESMTDRPDWSIDNFLRGGPGNLLLLIGAVIANVSWFAKPLGLGFDPGHGILWGGTLMGLGALPIWPERWPTIFRWWRW